MGKRTRGKPAELLDVMIFRCIAFLIIGEIVVQDCEGEHGTNSLEAGRKKTQIKSLQVVFCMPGAPTPFDRQVMHTGSIDNDHYSVPGVIMSLLINMIFIKNSGFVGDQWGWLCTLREVIHIQFLILIGFFACRLYFRRGRATSCSRQKRRIFPMS